MAETLFTAGKQPIQMVRDVTKYPGPPEASRTAGGSPIQAVRFLTDVSQPETTRTAQGHPIQVVSNVTASTPSPELSRTPGGNPVQAVRIWDQPGEVARTAGGNPIQAVQMVDNTGLPVSLANAEATAWQAKVVQNGGTVSAGQFTNVDTLISSLKTAGIWSNLDRLWLFASENTQQALVDLIATAAATPVSAPAFTVNRGYKGNGTSSYIDSNFIASTAPGAKFTQNNAAMGIWVVTPCVINPGYGIGNNDGAYSHIFVGRNVGDQRRMNVNAATSQATYNVTTITGCFHGERTGATAQQSYLNGAQEQASAEASTPLINQSHRILVNVGSSGSLNGFTDCQAGAAWIGGSLGAAGALAFYNALRTYMTAVGVP